MFYLSAVGSDTNCAGPYNTTLADKTDALLTEIHDVRDLKFTFS